MCPITRILQCQYLGVCTARSQMRAAADDFAILNQEAADSWIWAGGKDSRASALNRRQEKRLVNSGQRQAKLTRIELPNFLLEVANILEVAIHGSKSHIGDAIDLFEPHHDHLSKFARLDFSLTALAHSVHDAD